MSRNRPKSATRKVAFDKEAKKPEPEDSEVATDNSWEKTGTAEETLQD